MLESNMILKQVTFSKYIDLVKDDVPVETYKAEWKTVTWKKTWKNSLVMENNPDENLIQGLTQYVFLDVYLLYL